MFVENLRHFEQPENCLHTNKYEQTTTTFSCQTIILNCCCKSWTLLSAPHSKSKQSHLAFGSFHWDLVKNFYFHQNLAICGGKISNSANNTWIILNQFLLRCPHFEFLHFISTSHNSFNFQWKWIPFFTRVFCWNIFFIKWKLYPSTHISLK